MEGEPTASGSALRSPRPVSVTQCGLALRDVRLAMLLCAPGEGRDTSVPGSVPNPQGRLVAGSLESNGFTAEVTWTLQFPKESSPPVNITGKHDLTFSVQQPIGPTDAAYYAEVNAVILAFPYIRQVIQDLTAQAIGRAVIVPPLDVPKWVAEQVAAWAKRRAEQDRDAGEPRDDEDAADKSQDG